MTDDGSRWLFGAPGSDEALDHGCSCAVIDNGHGKGYMGDGEKFGWVISLDCDLHGKHIHFVTKPRLAAQDQPEGVGS